MRKMKQRSTTSKYLFAFFALFVIFADEMFLSFISFMGLYLESGMKAYLAIVIAAIAYSLMAMDFVHNRVNKRNGRIFLFLLLILALYLMTSMFYPPTEPNYRTELLVFGSLSIPACYVGMRMAREDYSNEMLKLLPFFVAVVAVFVGRAAISASMLGMVLGHDDVFSYQNASYYLAFSYS